MVFLFAFVLFCLAHVCFSLLETNWLAAHITGIVLMNHMNRVRECWEQMQSRFARMVE